MMQGRMWVCLTWFLLMTMGCGEGAGRSQGFRIVDSASMEGGGREDVSGFGFTSFGETEYADRDGEIFFTDADWSSPSDGIFVSNFSDRYRTSQADAGAAGASCGGAARMNPIPSGERIAAETERANRNATRATNAENEKAKATKKPTPSKTWKRSTKTTHEVRLKVGDEDMLPLEAMDISVHVDGFRARVVLDCFFRNTKDKALNGTFQLRLPTGASPHYLAFGRLKAATPAFTPVATGSVADIRTQRTTGWEAPKEARMVARETAARAYRDTIRERIDPALMEWAGSGVFSTQVFPLEPGALHQIVIAYDTDLTWDGDSLVHHLDLPVGVPSLDVAINIPGGATSVEPKGAVTGTRHTYKDPKGSRIITRVACPTPFVLTGTSSQAGPLFATEIQPPLPAADAITNPRAVFLVDVSASSTPERFNTWLALLTSILEQNRPSLKEFAVAFFNVETFWWREGFVANNAARTTQLRAFANRLMLEGATDLGTALAAAGKQTGAFDVFLLSDGGITWGETNAQAFAANLGDDHPVFSYVVPGGITSRVVLEHLARRSGGAVFPVVKEAEVLTVARAHRKRPWRLDTLRIDGTRDLLLAGRPTALFPGQRLRIAGRGVPKPGAEVILEVSQGARHRTIRVALAKPQASELAERTYGQIAVGQLEALGHSAAADARAYASHFRVVGASCSLLMLETEADYKARAVTPEDEGLVRTAPASRVVASRLADAEATLADPKRRLLARLDRLSSVTDGHLALPVRFRALVEALPTSAFRVERDVAACRVREARHVAPEIRTALAAGTLGYDAATAEAKRRRRLHGPADGLKVLSSLIEQDPADVVLTRDVAYSAMAWGRHAEAYHLLRRVAGRRPWESPTWLAVARCLDESGHAPLAAIFYELVMAWDRSDAYGAIQQVAAIDYTHLLRTLASSANASPLTTYAGKRLGEVEKLAGTETADLLVVIEWNTDLTDVDLHIWDAASEHCHYEHTTTDMGGRLSQDVTGGFGPELFVLPHARAGTYRIQAHYFRSNGLRTKARSKVFARVYEDWGRPNETVRRVTVTLETHDARHGIATVTR